MRGLTILFLSLAMLAACRTNEAPEGQVNDLEITARVKSRMASDSRLSSVTTISVNSMNGVVTLSGQTDSLEKRARAEADAKGVPQVVGVVNTVQIVTDPR